MSYNNPTFSQEKIFLQNIPDQLIIFICVKNEETEFLLLFLYITLDKQAQNTTIW